MKQHVLTFDKDGTVRALYADELRLQEFGAMKVERASNVEFDNGRGGWTVEFTDGTMLCAVSLARPVATYHACHPPTEPPSPACPSPRNCYVVTFPTRGEALSAEVEYLQTQVL